MVGTGVGEDYVAGQNDYLAKQLSVPEMPAKVQKPTRLDDRGRLGGNAMSVSTVSGDGEYEVMAEIVNYGGMFGERVAAIHIQFVADEDLLPYRSLQSRDT